MDRCVGEVLETMSVLQNSLQKDHKCTILLKVFCQVLNRLLELYPSKLQSQRHRYIETPFWRRLCLAREGCLVVTNRKWQSERKVPDWNRDPRWSTFQNDWFQPWQDWSNCGMQSPLPKLPDGSIWWKSKIHRLCHRLGKKGSFWRKWLGGCNLDENAFNVQYPNSTFNDRCPRFSARCFVIAVPETPNSTSPLLTIPTIPFQLPSGSSLPHGVSGDRTKSHLLILMRRSSEWFQIMKTRFEVGLT